MYVANISGTVKTYARIVTQGLQWRRNGIQVEGQRQEEPRVPRMSARKCFALVPESSIEAPRFRDNLLYI